MVKQNMSTHKKPSVALGLSVWPPFPKKALQNFSLRASALLSQETHALLGGTAGSSLQRPLHRLPAHLQRPPTRER